MKKLLFLVLLGIVLISGCTGNNGLQIQNAGGIIQDFSFDFGSVYDDDTSVLTVEVQNVGGKEITSTNLFIYGQTFGSGDDLWTATLPADMSLSDGYLTSTLSSAQFSPPDVEQGIPGEGRMYNIILDPPNMLDGIPAVRQDFYARLCFPYSTSTLTQVELTSKNEMRATQVTASKADTINAAGPLQLELKTQKNIRSKAGASIPLVFSVKDVGGGFSTLTSVGCSVDTATADRGWAEVSVTVDGNAADCGDGKVLIRKGEGTIYCTYTFGEATAPRTNFRVVGTATYNYYVEKAASIQVQDSSID